MATGRTITSSIKLLLVLITVVLVVPAFRDIAITTKKQVSIALLKGSTLPFVRESACTSIVCSNRKFKHRVKRFLSCRVQYTTKGTSSFNLTRNLLSCGDIATNPGPKRTRSLPKYPCSECRKAVRNNQDAILCTNCNKWSHAKCLPMSRPIFQYYLDKPNIEWCCPTCALPPLSDSFFAQDSEGEVLSSIMEVNSSECENEKLQENTAELSEDEEIISENAQLELLRRYHSKDLLIAHLNINSVQNKFEELSGVIKTIRAHIMFVSETKIDASYPNAQFTIPGYSLYRNDRKKRRRWNYGSNINITHQDTAYARQKF